MNLGRAGLQESSEQLELPYENAGEAGGADGSGEALRAKKGTGRSGTGRLMEEVVEATNLKAALKRVKQNKGGPGIDGDLAGRTHRARPFHRRDDYPHAPKEARTCCICGRTHRNNRRFNRRDV